MGTILTNATLELTLSWLFENELDLANAKDNASLSVSDELTDGNAIDAAEIVWHDERTVSASGTDSLDLAGGLTDAFGNTLTFTKIKGVAVKNKSTTAGDILTLGGNANGVPLFSDTSDKLKINPDGLFLWWDPSAAGITVTATTGDILDIIETGGSNSVTYQIVIVGTDT